MKFSNNLTVWQSLLIPGIGAIIWPCIFTLMLAFATPVSVHQEIASVVVGFICAAYVLLLIIVVARLVSRKEYRKIIALLFGSTITAIVVVAETIIIFGIAIAGGATG